MISKNLKKKLVVLGVTSAFICTMATSVFAQGSQKAVSLGANLTEAQKQQMLNEFNINKNEAKIIEITNDDIRIQLGMDRSKPVPASSKSISSSYVEVLDKGGIRVKANNLTEVTPTMLMNALLTSGVTDANVIASAPYPVTGTAALAGILKGFEDATGEELSLNQKEAARDEIKVTTDLGNNVTKEDGTKLDKDEAAVIINDIKTQVIKDSPKNDIDIENIVINITNNYGVELPKKERAQVVKLMSDINKLDYNYNDMKESLNQMNKNLKETLKEMGKEIKESGIFEKLWSKIKEFFSWIGDLFKGDKSSNTNSDIQYDSNGNIKEDQVTDTATEQIMDETNKEETTPSKENTNESKDKENNTQEKVENQEENNANITEDEGQKEQSINADAPTSNENSAVTQ
ncbi:DUF1002 domain-containing protein [Clostridium massiliamazoniense]|uniref:DUF1002 domain-containing protein n=1 Tax=Clostridium massiliamazoniense TaxID=1347366 RepID=UPI0006D7BA15|nr:DUF1002 domain-containing protein [Clostridium massiliamazoniense]